MVNQQPDLSNESIQRAEHIDPATTGDNIAAKRTANYVWDTNSSTWVRAGSASTVVSADNTASGTISTQNLVPGGVATALSAVEITLGAGQTSIAVQTIGTYTGVLTLQGTINGTDWVSFAGTPLLNANTGLWLATITSALQSVFFAKVAGFAKVRISANAAVTGSVVVSIGASQGDSFQGALGVLTTVTTVATLTNITNWGNIVDNAAFTDGTTRLSPSAYIFDEVAGTALTENDAAAARIDSKRAQIGVIEDATTRGLRAAVDSNGNLMTSLGTTLDATNDSIRIAGGLMPTATALNTYSIHLTSNTTTTPTASTAYISSIAISNEVGGTTSTITIQDKQGTPLKLINGIATTALTTAPTVINFQTPVKMVSGIDIITAGAVAATVDVWINYYQ